MSQRDWILTFKISKHVFALPLELVEVVMPMASLQPVTDAPDYVTGVLNFHQRLIPVVNSRALFNLPRRRESVDDHLILLRNNDTGMALWVDQAMDTVRLEEIEALDPKDFYVDGKNISGLVNLNDTLVLIQDINHIINSKEYLHFYNTLRD